MHKPHPRLRLWSLLIGTGALMGCLTTLALPPLHILPILLITFGMVGIFLNSSPSFWRTFCFGWVFGFFFYGTNLYWLVYAVILRADDYWWFVPFPSIGCAIILAPFVACSLTLSLFFKAGTRRLVAFAGLWTLFDMARIFIFSGFTWNGLGSSLALPNRIGDVLIQPASWVGEDGLTLVCVLLSTLLGTMLCQWLLNKKFQALLPSHYVPITTDRPIIISTGVFAVLWIVAGIVRVHAPYPQPSPNPYVVVVQGNIPESEKEDNDDPYFILNRYQELTHIGISQALNLRKHAPDKASSKQPIIFVWPETAFPATEVFLQETPTAVRRRMMAWAKGASYGLIGALRTDPQNHLYNSLFALDKDGEIVTYYDKSRLVPFGEYSPKHLPIQMSKLTPITPGNGVKTWHLPGVSSLAPLICYEMIFSGHVIDRHDRPQWLANVTNDAWFGNSAGPRQHLASVRLRAVEEGLPVVRAANTGISAIYDGRGHLLHSLGWDHMGVITYLLPAPLPPTLFAKYGQTIPIILCLAFLGIALLPQREQPTGSLTNKQS